jgi:hypothetical protein
MLRQMRLGTLVFVVVAAACGGTDAESAATPTGATPSTTTSTVADPPQARAPASGCADVINVAIETTDGGYKVSTTVRSADTGWEKYADLWEVRAPDGTVLGERVLAHPHVDEQPFTRSLSGVSIPDGIDEVTIAARDSVAGFCGAGYVAEVPGR